MYEKAIQDLRKLLRQMGRHDFHTYGYATQIRECRTQLNFVGRGYITATRAGAKSVNTR